MKKLIYGFFIVISLSASADNYRFPKYGLPAINIKLTRFTDDKESIIYSGRIDAQILCPDGRKISHQFLDTKGKPVNKICQFEKPVINPNVSMEILIGVPDMSKVHSPCSIGLGTVITVDQLERHCRQSN